ncbi:hypothetical protein [Methanohalophilus portucalensis]|uniref:hypothetical protein n=1 Tax=Methanohalophilus portucalensis TaxID=39664 RepID=UPI0012FDE149|nr:hypothetical protein [Methanohalophilus portucalensis]
MYACQSLPGAKKTPFLASLPRKLRQSVLQADLRDKSQCLRSADIGHAVADVAGAGILVFHVEISPFHPLATIQ